MSAYVEAEQLHYALIGHLEEDQRALDALADAGIGDHKADTTMRFLSELHETWRHCLLADREAKELSGQTVTLQEACKQMLRIWEQ